MTMELPGHSGCRMGESNNAASDEMEKGLLYA